MPMEAGAANGRAGARSCQPQWRSNLRGLRARPRDQLRGDPRRFKESGGGSVPGAPSSVMCSVQSFPDQYRCSCLPVGSGNQPGASPLNAPEDPAAGAGPTQGAPPGGLFETCGDRSVRLRLEESIRSTKRTPNGTRIAQPPCP